MSRTPLERKPIYVDFAAPALIDNLARLVRAAADAEYVQFVEMLPGPDELWLRDPQGRRYTAEARAVAVDAAEPAPVVAPHR